MSTVVFNPATPKRISGFVFFVFDYFRFDSDRTHVFGSGKKHLVHSLYCSSTHPPISHPAGGVGFVHCWKNKYDLASRGLFAINWNHRCSIPHRTCAIYMKLPLVLHHATKM